MTAEPSLALTPEEDQICTAITRLGELAGIDVARGEGPEDIDGALIQAAYECHFDDPQFLGGSGFLRTAASIADVEALGARAGRVVRGLIRYLHRRAAPETLRHARTQQELVDSAFMARMRSLHGDAPSGCA